MMIYCRNASCLEGGCVMLVSTPARTLAGQRSAEAEALQVRQRCSHDVRQHLWVRFQRPLLQQLRHVCCRTLVDGGTAGQPSHNIRGGVEPNAITSMCMTVVSTLGQSIKNISCGMCAWARSSLGPVLHSQLVVGVRGGLLAGVRAVHQLAAIRHPHLHTPLCRAAATSCVLPSAYPQRLTCIVCCSMTHQSSVRRPCVLCGTLVKTVMATCWRIAAPHACMQRCAPACACNTGTNHGSA